jgi:hypothetical protein
MGRLISRRRRSQKETPELSSAEISVEYYNFQAVNKAKRYCVEQSQFLSSIAVAHCELKQ